jgi:O-antigen/teichoic acid export membrane protein
VGALFFSGLAGIALAVQGYSYWSLVWMQLLNALFITVGRLWFVRWLPSPSINFGPVRRMFGFGVKILITGLMQALNFHLLTFIFGRYLPIQTVGYYSQANKWNNLAKTTIADTVGQVAQAVLVSVSDEKERELRVFRKMMRFTAFLSFPAMLGLAMVAREFILFLLGDQWESSVILLQILCVGGAFLPFYTLYQNLAISNGRSDLYMWCNIGQMVIQLLIVLLTYSYGIETVLWCCSVFNILWLLPWLLVAHRLIGLGLTEVLKDMAPFLLISLAVMFVTYMLTMGISQLLMLLVVRIVVAAGLYVVVMKMLNVAILKECLQFVKGKKVKE